LIEDAPGPVKGEIWIVRFDPTTGEEMKKTRPAVVVNDEHMGRESLRIVVPVTEWQAHHESCRWMFPLPPPKGPALPRIRERTRHR